MSVYEQLATRIRKLRVQRKWSQEELADRSDLHRTYISHIENAKRKISLETMCKLAKGFGVTPSKLMTGITLDR
ncbi:MAG: helix-turn-helix transcriptional regulator [Pseudomonadota bacterium]